MNGNFNEYKYNNCSARGVCSTNPKTTSLQRVIFRYIKHLAYYALKIRDSEKETENIKKLILFSVSILASNIEFSETDFYSLKNSFEKTTDAAISKYKSVCKQQGCKADILKPFIRCKKNDDIISYIKLGEKEFSKSGKNFSAEKLNLYEILFLIIKSLCINIISAFSYNINTDEYYETLLLTLNSLIEFNAGVDDIKLQIFDIANSDYELMKKIRAAQEDYYGEQTAAEVSYTTKSGKAVLVVGSDISELEKILKALKEYDIYTHDEMLIAHTFPRLKEYSNLKGQYGMGYENCLLDFSTFPGPIILTRNSLYNVENLYRGRLFSTDFVHSRGVIRIQNNDYSEVIQSAEASKGFKTGKVCDSELIGFNYNEVLNKLNQYFENEAYTGVVILGNPEGDNFMTEYYRTLKEHIPENFFVISMYCCKAKDNLFSINAPYDNYALSYIAEKAAGKKTVSVFMPLCKRHTVTDLIYLSENKNINIFWNTKCCTFINPAVIKSVCELAGIHIISTPKQDIEKLI